MKKNILALFAFMLIATTILSGCDLFNFGKSNNLPNNENTNYDVVLTHTQGGTVTGGGNFAKGTVVSVYAAVSQGYLFSNWTENSIVISTSANYSFTLNSNRALRANFVAEAVQTNEVLGEYYLSAVYNDGEQVEMTDLIIAYNFASNGDYQVRKLTKNDEPNEPPYKWTNVYPDNYGYQIENNKINTLNANGAVVGVNNFRFELNTLIISGSGNMLDANAEYHLTKHTPVNLTGNYQVTYVADINDQTFTEFAFSSVVYAFGSDASFDISLTNTEGTVNAFDGLTATYEVISNYIVVSIYNQDEETFGVVMVNMFLKNNINLQIFGDGFMLDDGLVYYCTKIN